MAVTPRIFISATSGDLKSHRATVAAALKKLETYAEVQDHWPPDYRAVEQMLRRRLKDCDTVIHLVGLRYGAEPGALPPGVPRRSCTRMEYHLARELKKPVYLFLLPATFPWAAAASLATAASDLNNLAQLLKDTNRLAEAEQLMRRMVGIIVNITVQTRHPHPHLNTAVRGEM